MRPSSSVLGDFNKRNARVFRNKHAPPLILLGNIQHEAKLRVLAGAKQLSNLILGE
jgi:hypothetical protein